LHIDGSYGEGGGQILRTAVALSVLTKTPVEITSIRANRPNPGIKPQHYTAIKIMGELCNAETDGLIIGSSNLTFSPGEITGGDYHFDIGTAGSIMLVFQACILCSVRTNAPITLRVIGGTDVKWSPSWDYFKHVFLPLIKKMGLIVNAQLIKRGYYPKGGGEVILTIQPCKDIQPLHLDKKQEFTTVEGIINIANLPDHVSKRMKHAAMKTLLNKNLDARLKIEKTTSLSAGTGMTLWTQAHNTILGATTIGEIGLPAEKIGENVAAELISEIESGATLDIHVFDQILPHLALTKESEQSSCIVREISSHAQTNMWLVSQFFGERDIFSIDNKKNLKVIKAYGQHSTE
jgi:RNA 3'-phosphate cyclase